MASNRDPRKAYRRRDRKTVTSSSNRSTRSKKSTVPKPTSSSTRASTKGSSSRVTTGQGGSRARVKTKPKSTGIIGTRNTPATKTTYTGPKTPGVSFDPSKRVKIKPGGGIGRLGGAADAIAIGAAIGEAYRKTNRAKSESSRGAGRTTFNEKPKPKSKPKKKPMASMGKDYKSKEKELSRKANASNFDNAFAKARKAGKSNFTWRGKKYNTKLK